MWWDGWTGADEPSWVSEGSFAKGSGTENLECCCLESGMGLRILSIFSKNSINAGSTMARLWWSFLLFILPEKVLPSAHMLPHPHISALALKGIFSHIIYLSSSSLGWMQESRVSAVPPPGQWLGSAEPWGLVVLPDFIPEECVCVCVKINFSFWGSFRVRSRSKYKDFWHTRTLGPQTAFLTNSIHTRVIHLLNQWTCIDASLSLRLH